MHSKHNPVHVTLRVVDAIGSMRRRVGYHAVRRAMERTLQRENFRIVHVSIQRNHIHLICEADDARALARGLQSFQSSAAHRLNTAASRQGTVFPERYHAEVLTSRAQTRNCISYVLNNWRHHGEAHRPAPLDPYASGLFFDGWNGIGPFAVPDGYIPLPVIEPKTWMLTTGWRRYGLLDPYARPGTARR